MPDDSRVLVVDEDRDILDLTRTSSKGSNRPSRQ